MCARARSCVCAAAVPAAGRRPPGSHGAGGVSTQPGVPDMLTNLREDQDDSRIRAVAQQETSKGLFEDLTIRGSILKYLQLILCCYCLSYV